MLPEAWRAGLREGSAFEDPYWNSDFNTCPICLENLGYPDDGLQSAAIYSVVTCCKHAFHAHCLIGCIKGIRQKTEDGRLIISCPMCFSQIDSVYTGGRWLYQNDWKKVVRSYGRSWKLVYVQFNTDFRIVVNSERSVTNPRVQSEVR